MIRVNPLYPCYPCSNNPFCSGKNLNKRNQERIKKNSFLFFPAMRTVFLLGLRGFIDLLLVHDRPGIEFQRLPLLAATAHGMFFYGLCLWFCRYGFQQDGGAG